MALLGTACSHSSSTAFLLLLDALPLALCVGIWCLFWPTPLIEATRKASMSDLGPSEYAPMAPLASSEAPPYNNPYDNNEYSYHNKYDA